MFSDPSFYLLLSFILFCAVVGRPLLKTGLNFLDGKIERITLDLQNARLKREEAQTQLNNAKMLYHKELRYAEDMVEQAKLTAEEHQKMALKELKKQMENRTLMTKNSMNVRKAQIVSLFRRDVALAVNQLVSAVLEEKGFDVSQEISKSISQLPKV